MAIAPAFTGSFTVTVSGNTGTSLPVSGSVTINAGATTPAPALLTSSGTLGNGTCSVTITGTASGNSFVVTGPNGYVFSNVYRTTGTYPIFAQGVREPGVYTLTITSTDGCGNSATASQQITIGGTACN